MKQKRRYKNSWTPEEDALLKKCVAAGMISKKIAPLLPNRGFEAIGARRRQLGIKRQAPIFPHDDPKTVAQIVKFRMAGWRLEDVEAVTGIRKQRLSWLVSRHGICVPRVVRMPASEKAHWTALELARLRRSLKHKEPVSLIHEKLPNRTPNAVRKKAWQMTRYWLSDAEQAARKRLRKKQLRVW